jgi:hypothetical protein
MLGDFSEKRALYEIMSKNMVEPERRLHVAGRISTHALTHGLANPQTQKYVILIIFHGYSGFVNAPQSYLTRTLPVLLFYCAFAFFHTQFFNVSENKHIATTDSSYNGKFFLKT